MPLRYAILHHTGVATPHFDVLIETAADQSLTTFRAPQWPPAVNDSFEERADHRRIYLDYEGPISGDRGEVSRVEAGTVESEDIAVDPPIFAMRFISPTQTLEVTLMHTMETGWVVSSVDKQRRA